MASTQEEIAQIEQARQTAVDTFGMQQQMIGDLNKVIDKIQGGSAAGTVYVQPQPVAYEKSPNYLLYIGIGIAALFFLKKGKLL